MTQSYDIGIETTVEIGRGATPTWTNLAGIIGKIDFPQRKRDDVDITHFNAAGNRDKVYIPGLSENGEMKLELLWEPEDATDTVLSAIYESGETVQIRITVPKLSGSDFVTVFKGYLREYQPSVSIDEANTVTALFKISEKVS